MTTAIEQPEDTRSIVDKFALFLRELLAGDSIQGSLETKAVELLKEFEEKYERKAT